MREIIGTDGIQMRKKIFKKLNSRRGASLTFALLLFLVCAAVGSVMLTSATATAGRVSENYEYDQRYYAVTSAAELLRDTLGGESLTATVMETTTRPDTVVTRFDRFGTPLGAPVTTPDDSNTSVAYSELHIKNSAGNTPDDSNLLYKVLTDMIAGRNAKTVFEDGVAIPSTVTDNDLKTNYTKTFTLTVTPDTSGVPTATPVDSLEVEVTMAIRRDGSLHFVLKNTEGTDKYMLQMTLVASISTDVKTID